PEGSSVHPRVAVVPVEDRSSYLDRLAAAHVFVSPTEFEGYGMALVEAAAHGLALVTTFGPGMEHVAERFVDGVHGLFVSTSASLDERVAAVRDHVLRL